MKRYLAYIRVSTPKQGRGVSLEEQQAAIKAHAVKHNLKIIRWFEEKQTAAKEGRREFSKLLSALTEDEADGVIIHKIDRSARNLRDWASLGELIDRGVDVRFVSDGLDLQSRGGRLSADIQAIVAADYVRNLKDEVRKGIYGRLKQGIYPFGAPVGYLDAGGGNPKTIDPFKGPLVRWAFERYAGGTVGLQTLVIELAKRGLVRPGGQPLSLNGISTILHNPFYMSVIRVKDQSFAGKHEPLVSKALFDAVQNVMAGKAPKLTAPQRPLLFQGLIRCSACGYRLVGERKKAKYTYYRCWRNDCGKAALREETVDSLVRYALKMTELSPEELGDLREMALEELAQGKRDVRQQQTQLRLRLDQCETRLTRLTDALLDEVIDKPTYEARKAGLLGERRAILDALAGPIEPTAETVLSYLELPNIQHSGYENANLAEQRAIVRSLTWNLVVSAKEPAICLKSPYREIVECRISSSGGPIRGALGTFSRRLFKALKKVAARDANTAAKKMPLLRLPIAANDNQPALKRRA